MVQSWDSASRADGYRGGMWQRALQNRTFRWAVLVARFTFVLATTFLVASIVRGFFVGIGETNVFADEANVLIPIAIALLDFLAARRELKV